MRRFCARAVAPFTVGLVFTWALAGCASRATPKAPSVDHSRLEPWRAPDAAAITHLLERATFAVRPQDVEAVRGKGIVAFLDRQMDPQRIDDRALEQRLAKFETLNLTSREIAERYYLPAQAARRQRQAAAGSGRPLDSAQGVQAGTSPRPTASDQEVFRRERLVLQELANQKLLRGVYSERQLQEVLVDFWFNHFNVFAGKGADRGLLTAYERDAIRPRVFGRFRDLLGATAESPAMLFYLDNWMSVDPRGPHPARAGRPPYGRAALQASPLLPQQTAQPRQARRGLNENYARELMELHTLGADGSYTQRDVIEVARCFTGWTITQPRDGGTFRFDARLHDDGQKTVLGHVIKAGGDKSDGDAVLDILSRDPHTARLIASKLVRRFVADDPPPALVDRVAARFRQTDGDLREVYRAIFLSDSFWTPSAYDGKTKTPFEFVVSALRVTGAQVDEAGSAVQALRLLGMPPYYCQAPNGYADRGDAWLNAGTLITRMNFALALADNRLAGVRVDLASLAEGRDLDVARTQLPGRLLSHAPSPGTLAVLGKASTMPQLIAFVLGAPEFQKR